MSNDNVLGVIDAEIAQLEAQIRPLQEKRDWLKALKRKAGATNGTRPVSAATRHDHPRLTSASAKATATSERSVRDLMIDYVREHGPAPVRRSEIVEYLLSQKKSTSANPRQMMFGYITGMISLGHLAKGPERDEVVLGPVPWNPQPGRRE